MTDPQRTLRYPEVMAEEGLDDDVASLEGDGPGTRPR
jgi:hypothetical protein